MDYWQQRGMEELVREHGDCLYRFCCNISENLFDAEDLFQETFLRAIEKADRVLDTEVPKNYLIGIAIRLDKNRRRKAARRKRITPDAHGFDRESEILDAVAADEKSIEDKLIEMEQIRIIRENAKQMDHRNQIIAALYYGEGMKVREIAEMVRLPQGTVKSRLSRIRKQLRKGLEGDFDE